MLPDRPPSLRTSPLAASVIAALACIVLQTSPSRAQAEVAPSPTEPSLALDSDRDAPWPRFALSFDGLGAVWNEYVGSLRAAPSRHLAFRLDLGLTRDRQLVGRSAVELWVLGRGLDGAYLSAGALAVTARRYGAFAEVGYVLPWRGLLIDLALRGEYGPGETRLRARARIALGATF
ncbi:MAG: hypothetical protein AAF411_14815 [Myxococcota bacterium]